MTENPYATPATPVADYIQPSTAGGAQQTPFFPVSAVKLAVMCLCTLNVYLIYWFYKHWQLVKERENSDIRPFWRGFFAIFFAYSLFKIVREVGVGLGLRTLPAGPLAAGFILTSLAWRLPDPYSLISFFAIFFILPVQAYINRANTLAEPNHDRNSRFVGWNWVAIVVGGGVFLLALLGMFLPEA